MYLAYYKLKEHPFQISTNPAFLWMGEKHREALASLNYAIQGNKGFLLLTGDAGTGKTTLINALLEKLGLQVKYASISDPGLEPLDFFKVIAYTYGFETIPESKGEFVIAFSRFLSSAYKIGQRVLLVIDEAQRLNQTLLEEIRLLSNIERKETKLLNIFFVGQPEFNHIILLPENQAIRQRIAVNYHIRPLSEGETGEYIAHRLKVAGYSGRDLFTPEAVEEVYRFSKGYPRLMNVICDRAMISGLVENKHLIDAGIIRECAGELRIPSETAHKGPAESFIPEKLEAHYAEEEVMPEQEAPPPPVRAPSAAGTTSRQRRTATAKQEAGEPPRRPQPAGGEPREASAAGPIAERLDGGGGQRWTPSTPKVINSSAKRRFFLLAIIIAALLAAGYFAVNPTVVYDRVQEWLDYARGVRVEGGTMGTGPSRDFGRPDGGHVAGPKDGAEATGRQQPIPLPAASESVLPGPQAGMPAGERDRLPTAPLPETRKEAPSASPPVTAPPLPAQQEETRPPEPSLTPAELAPLTDTAASPAPAPEKAVPAQNQDQGATGMDSKIKDTVPQAPPAEITDSAAIVKVMVRFNMDSYDLNADAQRDLNQFAAGARKFPDKKVRVSGYTSSWGQESYNQRLSEYRANIVKRYLVEKGLAPAMIEAIGQGSKKPLADNDTLEGKIMNRRVEVEILP